MTISFDVDAADAALISKIVDRGMAMDITLGNRDGWERMSCEMDITATHANGNPLRLADMLAADDFNFGHDWYGIRNKIDRDTGQMTDCFSPRFTQRQTTPKVTYRVDWSVESAPDKVEVTYHGENLSAARTKARKISARHQTAYVIKSVNGRDVGQIIYSDGVAEGRLFEEV